MDNATLKKVHPQKYYLKYICSWMYYFGVKDCWYEESASLPGNKETLYNCWKVIVRIYMYLGTLNEYCAYFRANLSEKENNDLIQFCCAHSTVCGKITLLILQKNRIKMVMERFLESSKRISMVEVEEASVKKAVKYSAAIAIGSYVTLLAALVDGITTHFKDGVPLRVEVTYYPKSNDTVGSCILRFFVELHWYFIVSLMILIDCLTSSCLLFLAARFQLLQKYFEGLREKFLKNPEMKTQSQLEEEYLEAFVEGIKKHEHTLWCTRKIQYALGNVYSMQLIESISLLVLCLLKLVRNERNLTFLLANFTYLGIMIVLTGVYMIPAGNITWEASRVPTSIFNSGWELVSHRSRRLRTLVVVAMIRSQVPVEMTAFGIYTLSYTSFISVLRMSYSFFAVMY